MSDAMTMAMITTMTGWARAPRLRAAVFAFALTALAIGCGGTAGDGGDDAPSSPSAAARASSSSYTASPTPEPSAIPTPAADTPAPKPSATPAADTPTPKPGATPDADTPTPKPGATPDADAPTPKSSATPDADTPTPKPGATPDADAPTPKPVAVPAADAPTPKPSATPTPAAYDSNRAMRDVFPGFGLTGALMYDTLDEIAARKDASLVPVLVEMMRFMPSENARDAVARTLAAVTGQAFSGDEWDLWMEWLGANLADYQPPSEYVAWKEDLYYVIDPRFAWFLRPAREFSRIDPTEIVWGGVLPDGIPDLRNPKFEDADEQTFMNPDDRVFGVEINGDARAYPLRIVNAHEMVNDVVGGEPVSLMW